MQILLTCFTDVFSFRLHHETIDDVDASVVLSAGHM